MPKPLLAALLMLCHGAGQALEAVDDAELAEINGQFRIVVSDFFFDAGSYNSYGGGNGVVRMTADPYNWSDISELRLYRAGAPGFGATLANASDPIHMTIGTFPKLKAVDWNTCSSCLGVRLAPYRILDDASTSGSNEARTTGLDALDLHFRVDSKREISPTIDFDSVVDLKGVKLVQSYGVDGASTTSQSTQAMLWASSSAGDPGPRFGVSLNADIDEVRVQTVDPLLAPTAAQVTDGSIVLQNIQVRNLNLGTVRQPLAIRGLVDGGGRFQFQVEVATLTSANPDAPDASLAIERMSFGTPVVFDNGTAFQPLAGQNLITVQGLEIQHLRITTQDI